MDSNNKYSEMQRGFYNTTTHLMAKENHRNHDANPDYWSILLKPIRENSVKWKGKNALDFGCGTGRNVTNMWRMAEWERVAGVDISENNIKKAEEIILSEGVPKKDFFLNFNDGVSLNIFPDDTFDFVMSTIVFQHIAVYEIRYNLMAEIFRTMRSGGVFSFQMGFGEGHGKATYYENAYNATGTNSLYDTTVTSTEQLRKDLEKIGFINFEYEIRPSFSDGNPFWVFIKVIKQ